MGSSVRSGKKCYAHRANILPGAVFGLDCLAFVASGPTRHRLVGRFEESSKLAISFVVALIFLVAFEAPPLQEVVVAEAAIIPNLENIFWNIATTR
jgi:hypothetical protein